MDVDFLKSHVYQLVEVAVRIELTLTGPSMHELATIKEASTEFLGSLERKIGSSDFIGIYSEVQQKLQSKRMERKRKFALTAVTNPQEYAMMKVMKRAKPGKTSKLSLREMAVTFLDKDVPHQKPSKKRYNKR